MLPSAPWSVSSEVSSGGSRCFDSWILFECAMIPVPSRRSAQEDSQKYLSDMWSGFYGMVRLLVVEYLALRDVDRGRCRRGRAGGRSGEIAATALN